MSHLNLTPMDFPDMRPVTQKIYQYDDVIMCNAAGILHAYDLSFFSAKASAVTKEYEDVLTQTRIPHRKPSVREPPFTRGFHLDEAINAKR